MDKQFILSNQFWFVSLIVFSLFFLVLYAFDYSALSSEKTGVSFLLNSFSGAFNVIGPKSLDFTQKSNETISSPLIDTITKNPVSDKEVNNFTVNKKEPIYEENTENKTKAVAKQPNVENRVTLKNIEDSCLGRYIYVHDLPRRFNDDVIKNCKSLVQWLDFCPYLTNSGLGPLVQNPEGVLLKKGWFATNQFLLEVIFHNRMKKYECLTSDSSLASVFFVPFYAGFDVGRYLWDGYNVTIRDSLGLNMVKWLVQKHEWKRMWGRDHFFVAGRIAWDFHRQSDNDSDWGNKLMSFPESMNMTMLSIETTSWSNEFAIPYPTYFHPSSDREVIQWQKRMRRRKRRYLFSFAGAPRPAMKGSIRGEIISQCLASGKSCKLLDCDPSHGKKCDNPVEVIRVFQDSIFCLQPPGDSYTRRSTFDSILAGCIPVFFHPGSAYAQYTWYFPKNYNKYSVFIPIDLIKDGKVSINETLLQVPNDKVLAMRKEVIKLIPKVIYANSKSKLKTFDDAFDVAVKGVLERVEKVRRDIREGKDPSIGFAQENTWRLKLSGTGKEDEWDHLF